MQDRKEEILKAAIATLREDGISGFTQPRVAKRADVRQSHLTYYFPTRLALLEAVGRIAVDSQLLAFDELLSVCSLAALIKAMTGMTMRHEKGRVLMALAQAAAEEPSLRQLFRELHEGALMRMAQVMKNLKICVSDEQVYLIHALSVGLSVIDLAGRRPNNKQQVQTTFETLFAPLACRARK